MSTKSKAAAAEEKKPITLSSEHVPLSYRIKKDLQRNGMIYAMLIPVLVYYAIFKFGPMFGLYISFIDYKPARGIFGSKFVGLKWFKSFFSDYYFGRPFNSHILDLLDKEEIKYRSEKRLLGYRNKGKRRLAGNANQPIIINIDDVADVIDVRAEDEFARVELLVSLKQELERLSPRELMIIRTYLDYPIEVVARKLKVRPNTISKARRKIARELRKKLV